MENPTELALTSARRQHGLLTVGQARDAGLTDKRRATLIRRGLLLPVGGGVFRAAGTPRTDRQEVAEACLVSSAVTTETTAASLHGLTGFDLRPVSLLVRDGRQSARSTAARVHTTTWLPQDHVVFVDSIPTLSVARTLFSLAAMVPNRLDERAVVDAVEEAVRRKLATDAWLWWLLEQIRRSGRNGVSTFERILGERSSAGPTESWLERESLRVLASAGLPLPVCQARVAASGAFVARVDFRYPGTMAILEVNGHRFHSGRAQIQRDAARRRNLVSLGFAVYDFTYDDIVHDPGSLVTVARSILGLPVAA